MKKLTWITFALLTVASTASIAQLTSAAEYGMGAIFIYLFPAVVFLLPVSLVAAELATGWKGGVFEWVQAGLGDRWGFQAIWLQWIQSVTLYPSLLSFAAASLAFSLRQQGLAKNGLFTGIVILVIFWASTFVAMRGLHVMSRIANVGLVLGTIIPVIALVAFMIYWLVSGHQSAVPLKATNIIPPFKGLSSIVLIIGTFIAFSGLEVNAVHVRSLERPNKNYPKALVVAFILILAIYIPGTLAIATIIPAGKLDLDGGATQALTAYASGIGFSWLGIALSLALLFGAISSALTWVAGPSRGLLALAQQGFLPEIFARTNKAGIQTPLLIGQGILVSLLTLLFVMLPSVSNAFWILQSMTVILYLMMYILLFIAVIALRKKQPDVQRLKIPAIRLVAGVGIVASVAAIIIGFVPPSQFPSSLSPLIYIGGIALGVAVLAIPPQILLRYRRHVQPPDMTSAPDAANVTSPDANNMAQTPTK